MNDQIKNLKLKTIFLIWEKVDSKPEKDLGKVPNSMKN